MRILKSLLALFVLATPFISAQTTTTTATIIDQHGIAWANAAYTVSVLSPIQPVTSPENYTFTTSFSGTANSSGFFSLTLQRVKNMYPANLTWQFCVTPAVSAVVTYCATVPVGNAGQSSQNVSAQINAVIQPPVIGGGVLSQGYDDSEFAASPGNQYFNVISSTFRCYTTSWASCASGSGGGMVYPAAGVAVSTGSAWGTSLALAAVATSGSYTDLTNKPTIPAAQVNSDWNSVSGLSQILNKPTIPAAVTIDSQTGAFTFGGSGVSHTGTAYTFTSSGGGGSSVTLENVYSAPGAFTFAHNLNSVFPQVTCYTRVSGSTYSYASWTASPVDANDTSIGVPSAGDYICAFSATGGL